MVVLTKKKNVSKSKSRNGSRTKFRLRSKSKSKVKSKSRQRSKTRTRTRKNMRGGSEMPHPHEHMPRGPTRMWFASPNMPSQKLTESYTNVAPKKRIFNKTRRFVSNTAGTAKRGIVQFFKGKPKVVPVQTTAVIPKPFTSMDLGQKIALSGENMPRVNFLNETAHFRSPGNFVSAPPQNKAIEFQRTSNGGLTDKEFTPQLYLDTVAEAAYNADKTSQRTGITAEEYEQYLSNV